MKRISKSFRKISFQLHNSASISANLDYAGAFVSVVPLAKILWSSFHFVSKTTQTTTCVWVFCFFSPFQFVQNRCRSFEMPDTLCFAVFEFECCYAHTNWLFFVVSSSSYGQIQCLALFQSLSVKDPACLALDFSIALSVLVGAFKTINLRELDTLRAWCVWANQFVWFCSC